MFLFSKASSAKFIFLIITAFLLLSISLFASGCSSAVSPANNGQKLKKPFIPPADESILTGCLSQIQDSTGNASLHLDNSRNDFHVKAAIFKLTSNGRELTAMCNIRRKDQFTIHNISAGNYEIQFQNLNTGKYFKAEPPLTLADGTHNIISFYIAESATFKLVPTSEADF